MACPYYPGNILAIVLCAGNKVFVQIIWYPN